MSALRNLYPVFVTPHGVWPALRLFRAGALLFTALVVSGALSYASYVMSEQESRARLDDAAQRQLDLYATTLEGELKRYASLPELIEVDEQLRQFLRQPSGPSAAQSLNRRLATLAVRANVMSLFLMNREALVIAASDWYQAGTYYGSRLGQRFILEDALAGNPQRYVVMRQADGATEIAFIYPFLHEGTVIGLIGFRISLSVLESTWRELAYAPDSEKILVVDENNLVILTSAPEWKLAGAPDGLMSARLASPHAGRPPYVVHERMLTGLDWKMQILCNPAALQEVARSRSLGVLVLCAFFSPLMLHLHARRSAMQCVLQARHALEHANFLLEEKVVHRTQALRVVNDSLVDEIRQREQAQADLIHASRLAFLGQMSASVSHEIGQPLTALRALARNARIQAERSNSAALFSSLADISGLVEKIGRISMQLKSFAYRDVHAPQRFAIQEALNQVRQLTAERVAGDGVTLIIDVADCAVLCDQPRLEQVLLNLTQNALDAMQQQAHRLLAIRGVIRDATPAPRLWLQVQDSGPGIPAHVLPRLFEPFFTTKQCGAGLGLGLAICADIVREFGGSLRASSAGAGTIFEFDIPLASTDKENAHG